jgi:hypothetical protein
LSNKPFWFVVIGISYAYWYLHWNNFGITYEEEGGGRGRRGEREERGEGRGRESG